MLFDQSDAGNAIATGRYKSVQCYSIQSTFWLGFIKYTWHYSSNYVLDTAEIKLCGIHGITLFFPFFRPEVMEKVHIVGKENTLRIPNEYILTDCR